jgi:hypothetical protein
VDRSSGALLRRVRVACPLRDHVRRRLAAYSCFAAIWAAVTAEGYYGPVFWPAVGLLFVIAAAALWGALRIYRGRAGASTTGKRQARAVG